MATNEPQTAVNGTRAALPSTPAAPARRRPPTVAALWMTGAVLLWALYSIVFIQTTADPPLRAAVHAFANVLPLALLAIVVRAVLRAEVMPRSTAVQAAWHAALSIGFAFTWYATLVFLLALYRRASGERFELLGFSGPALTWQVFQGLVLYAAIAAVCYAVRGGREAAQVAIVAATGTAPLSRYLVRQGDDFVPVDVADIVSLTGAQDYVEVATIQSRHLIRLSLAELEAKLDPNLFLRVHRSTIINLAQLERTEPAGSGRYLAHMADGSTVRVSRAGVQLLRKLMFS